MANNLNQQYRSTVSSTPLLVVSGNYNLVSWNINNLDATAAYLKFYNAAAANSVTVGTTTPVKTLFIPASGCAFLSNEEFLQNGFNLGIVVACVTGAADNNTSAPSTGVLAEIQYQANP